MYNVHFCNIKVDLHLDIADLKYMYQLTVTYFVKLYLTAAHTKKSLLISLTILFIFKEIIGSVFPQSQGKLSLDGTGSYIVHSCCTQSIYLSLGGNSFMT